MEATVETPVSTPVTTPSSAAAPATSEPASAPVTATRPITAKEAFAKVEAEEAAKTAEPVTATTQPSAPAAQPVDPNAAPPQERWPTVLENARTKAVTARDAQWMEKYGWATKVPQQALQGALEMVQRVGSDPVGHLRDFVTAALDTAHGPALRAELARLAGNGNGNGHAAENYEPDVEIVGPDGRPQGKTFSAEKVTAIVNRAVSEAIGKEVAPLQRTYQQQQQRERDQQTAEAARVEGERRNKRIDAGLDRALKILDGNKDLLSEVSKLIPDGPMESLEAAIDATIDAALTVRQQKISPNVEQNATAKAAEAMRQKAAANTANGRSSASTPQSKPTNRKELAQLLERLDAKSA